MFFNVYMLVLFDIDGTLVENVKAHHDSFAYAFRKVYGINSDIDVVEHFGCTDRQIIISVLLKEGLEIDLIHSKLDDCMDEMVIYFEKNCGEVILLEGVKELLNELKKKGILLGLVTGNIDQIAEIKLKKAGIFDYFLFSDFGGKDVIRSHLVENAINSAIDYNLLNLDNVVFVVGDTPNDVKAGKEAKVNVVVKTIVVATGNYSIEDLNNTNSDFVLSNLNREDFIKIIEKY